MKRVVLLAIILSMVLCLFAGCKTYVAEENATLGEFVEGNSFPEDDDGVDEHPAGDQQQDQTPSDDKEDKNPSKDDEPADDEPDQSEPNTDKENETPGKDEPNQKEPDEDEEPQETPSDTPVDPDAEDSGWYKVLSFNIKSMYYNPETGNTGTDMRAKTVEIMKAIDADIVGLQEVDVNTNRGFNINQAKWLAEQLGYEYYHFTQTKALDNGTGDYGHAILSRFPISNIEEVLFRSQNEDKEQRKYTRVVLDIDGKEVVYINAHLTTQNVREDGSRDTSMGEAQFREVANLIQKETRPTILTGDFNLPIKVQLKLYDRSKMTPMNGGKTQSNLHEMISIDNIYVTNNLEHYVDENDMSVFVGLETSSDHDPLWSYFKFK